MGGDKGGLFKIDAMKAPVDNSIAIGPFGSRMKADLYTPTGVPVIRGNNISDTKALTGNFVFVSEKTADQLKSCNVFPGDLVFPHRGAIGEVGIVPRDGALRYLLSTSLMKLSCNEELVDPEYLFYFFRSPIGRYELLKNASTVGTPGIATPLTSLRSIEVLLPPLPEQRAIAHILGTLDDKIELNRRMNETLETMARALFKSWFVDFDPVRAKAEGRDPGLPKHVADLFPDSFEDSELGEIPKGWKVWRVGDIGNVICGKTPSTKVSEYYDNDVPFITIPDMHGKIFVTTTQKKLSQAGAASQKNKMLPPGAICVSCIATPGLVVLTSEESQTNQQINTVIPREADETYFWFWIFRDLGDEIKASGSGGSVLSNLSMGRFAELRVLAPPATLRFSYHSFVTPLFNRILTNEQETNTLVVLRDTLLPKLISGELQVKDAEKFLGRVSV